MTSDLATSAMPEKINVTEAAKSHIREALAARDAVGMRFGVKKSGCSGLAYAVDYIHEIDPQDKHFTIDDQYAVYVNDESWPYVKGTTIDYIREGLNAHFSYENPNVEDSCGCGESFTIEE